MIHNNDGHLSDQLIVCAQYGIRAAVELLINRRANVNHVAQDDEFALHRAAASGFKEICILLLRAGADKSLKFREQPAAAYAKSTKLGEFIKAWIPGLEVCVPDGNAIASLCAGPVHLRSCEARRREAN